MARSDPQPIEIPFTGGEGNDVDAKLMPRGKFTTLQNLEYDKIGRLVRREDIVAGSETLLWGVQTMVSTRQAVRAVSHGDQLLFFGDGTVWAYLDDEDKLAQYFRTNYKLQRATFDPVRVLMAGSGATGGPTIVDVCSTAGFTMVAWVESNTAWITVLDESTGATLMAAEPVSTTNTMASAPASIRCVASGDRYLHVLFVELATQGTGASAYHRLYSVTVDTNTMSIGSPTEREQVKDGNELFDADIGRDGPVVCYAAANGVSGELDIKIEEFNDSWVSQRSTTVVSALTSADVDGLAMAAAKDASDSYYVVTSAPMGGG